MDNLTKFKIKTFLYYLIIEPWTEKVSLPNFRFLIWILIIIASLFRLTYILLISVIIGVILHLVYEYKSGKFIYWYRQYQRKKYGIQKDTSKEKEQGGNDEEKNLS